MKLDLMDYDRRCTEIVTQAELLSTGIEGRICATGFLADDQVRKLDGDDSADVPATWLMDGATRLAHTLRTAGPGTKIWTPLDLDGTASFWARRFAHETLIHRADATLAVDTEFTVAEDVALDAIEWMELDSLPKHFEYKPQKRDLLGPGRTLGLAGFVAGPRRLRLISHG